jgi:hypothetical protein
VVVTNDVGSHLSVGPATRLAWRRDAALIGARMPSSAWGSRQSLLPDEGIRAPINCLVQACWEDELATQRVALRVEELFGGTAGRFGSSAA